MTWDQVVLKIHYLGEMEEEDLKKICNFLANLVSDLDGLSEFQNLLSIYLSDQRKLLIYTHLLAVQKNRFHFGWRTYVYIRTYTINQYYIQDPRLNFSFILWFWKFLVRNKLLYYGCSIVTSDIKKEI